jgi:hypothetical protein
VKRRRTTLNGRHSETWLFGNAFGQVETDVRWKSYESLGSLPQYQEQHDQGREQSQESQESPGSDANVSQLIPHAQWAIEAARYSWTEEEKNGKRRREEDRHNYDDEERFAILYLRIIQEEKWSEILKHFNVLFPPGSLRRQVDKGLTKTYPQRAKGGLECRYYRLRQDLQIPPLRSTGHSSDFDKTALARLQQGLKLSDEFLQGLRGLR